MKLSAEEFNLLFDRIDNSFIGSEEHVYGYQNKYVNFFLPERRLVVDFGCGQGAFLRALHEQNINCVGVDINPVNVDACIQKGFHAELVDGYKYIAEHEGQIDGIFFAHVIEHFTAQEAVKILVQFHESLMLGGRLILLTPNFGDPNCGLERFWLSSTHVRPYPLRWLENSFEQIGFSIIAGGYDPFGGDTYVVGEKISR